MFTVAEVAKQLRVCQTTIYELVADGKLACYRIGRRRGTIRFTEADVSAYLEACRSEGEVRKPPLPSHVLKHLRP